MIAQPLLKILEKLYKLYKSLQQLALEKTEVLKKGDMEALKNVMQNEQSHISAIQVIEKERVKVISELVPGYLNPTLSDCMSFFDETDKEKVLDLQEKLTSQLFELKTVNELNQQLLEQSLQLVSLNIDLIRPQSPSNYSKDEEENTPNLTIFDSKA